MNTSSKKQSDNLFSGLNQRFLFLILLLIGTLVFYVARPKNIIPILATKWVKQYDQLGVGSPRLADVNQDGVADIIIGSGFEWSSKDESAMNAIDGKSGERIWRSKVPESAYGTPLLVDINNDGVLDVTASGRFPDFYMLDGKTGQKLWVLSQVNSNIKLLPCNFNTPTPVDDMDNDGIDDFIVIQGGLANNTKIFSIYDETSNKEVVGEYNKDNIMDGLKKLLEIPDVDQFNLKICINEECESKMITRQDILYSSYDSIMVKLLMNQEGPGSKLYLISSKTGQILNIFPVPESRESWSVPIYFKHNGSHRTIYGSGGERKDGFFQSQDIQTGEIHWNISTIHKGAISSPLLTYEKNIPIMIGSTMGGYLFKLNALTGELIWRADVGLEYETYSSVALINFNGKAYPDVVGLFSRGVWPKYESAAMFIFDGQSGEIVFRKKIGFCNGASSPVIADIDDDLLDDIILVTCTDRQPRLLVINNDKQEIFSEVLDSGAYSTPIVEDIDKDGHLDIIVSRFHFIDRFSTTKKQINIRKNPWNQYRGAMFTGVID